MTTQSIPRFRPFVHHRTLIVAAFGAALIAATASYATFRDDSGDGKTVVSSPAASVTTSYAPVMLEPEAYAIELDAIAEANAILATTGLPQVDAFAPTVAGAAAAAQAEWDALAEANGIRAITGLEPVVIADTFVVEEQNRMQDSHGHGFYLAP